MLRNIDGRTYSVLGPVNTDSFRYEGRSSRSIPDLLASISAVCPAYSSPFTSSCMTFLSRVSATAHEWRVGIVLSIGLVNLGTCIEKGPDHLLSVGRRTANRIVEWGAPPWGECIESARRYRLLRSRQTASRAPFQHSVASGVTDIGLPTELVMEESLAR